MEDEKITTQTEKLQKDKTEKTEIEEEKAPAQDADTNADDNVMSKNMVINDAMTSEDLLQSCSWEVNDLAWARMSIYPFWPCIVTHDPNSLMTFKKVQSVRNSKTLMIHVHFFNDNARHCWVPAHHMIPFVGIEDFRKRASLVTDSIRKKEPKFAAALTIKPGTFSTWQKAVAEAMDVLFDLDLSPLENFKAKVKEETKDSSAKSTSAGRKRKRKDDDKSTAKISKPNTPSTKSKVNTETDNPQLQNLNLETPPVSPPMEEDLRAEELKKQKKINKMINKLQPPDFEVYFDRNLDIIKESEPEATEEHIREYLKEIWSKMPTEEKQRFRSTYKIEADS